MVEYAGNAIPAPGYTQGGNVPDDELLYSTVGYTQKGVTLKAGQGVLPLGTILGRVTADKTYVPYDTAATDGSEIAVGILRKTVETGSDAEGQNYLANIVISGLVQADRVEAANTGDAETLAATLGGHHNAALGYIKI